MKKVAAYSFFRNEYSEYESDLCGVAKGRFFVNYLPAVIRSHHAVWKDWELWIYHDNRVLGYEYFGALQNMQAAGLLKLIPFGDSKSLTGIGGMLERMRAVFDWDVEYLLMRDVDSLSMPRERKMVEYGLFEQKALAHTIHDSISHSGMCGGLTSFNCKLFRERFEATGLEQLVSRVDGLHIDWNQKGGDQKFLNGYIAPNIVGNWVIHHFPGKLYGSEFSKIRVESLPRECRQDTLASHLGGCYDAEAAAKWYDENLPNEAILKAEKK